MLSCNSFVVGYGDLA